MTSSMTTTKLSRRGESYAEVLVTAVIIGLLIAVFLYFIQGSNSTFSELIGHFIGSLFTILFWAFIVIFGVMFLNFVFLIVFEMLSGGIGGGKSQNIAQSQQEAKSEQVRNE
jgi:uncharacterized membrane protein YbhN (UPF0104 family)